MPKRIFQKRIKLIIFDFDGVFTDNKVYTTQDGVEIVKCDRRDGLGIRMLKLLDIPMFILTMELNPVVVARARKMGLDVVSGCENKGVFLKGYFKEKGIDPASVLYVGNDLNDLDAMKIVGLSVCPKDGHKKVKKAVSYILDSTGGNGAVRELAELVAMGRNRGRNSSRIEWK